MVEISQAMNEQNLGAGQIRDAVHKLNDSVKHSNQSVDKALAVSEGLADSSLRLTAQMRTFALSDAGAQPDAVVQDQTQTTPKAA